MARVGSAVKAAAVAMLVLAAAVAMAAEPPTDDAVQPAGAGRRAYPAGLTQCVSGCGNKVTSCMLGCYGGGGNGGGGGGAGAATAMPFCLIGCTSDVLSCTTGCSASL